MMIWLSKNLLGYTDKIETKEVSKEDTKSLVEEAKRLTKELDVGGVC